jgi:hypothetical protein
MVHDGVVDIEEKPFCALAQKPHIRRLEHFPLEDRCVVIPGGFEQGAAGPHGAGAHVNIEGDSPVFQG